MRFNGDPGAAKLQFDWRVPGPIVAADAEYDSLTLAIQFESSRGTLVQLLTPAGGEPEPVQLGRWDADTGSDWHGYEILSTPDVFEVWMDGAMMVSVTPPVQAAGRVALLTLVEGEENSLDLDDVQVCRQNGAFQTTWPWEG